MNLVEMMVVAAAVQLQEMEIIRHKYCDFSEESLNLLDIADDLLCSAGLRLEDWDPADAVMVRSPFHKQDLFVVSRDTARQLGWPEVN